MFLSTLVRQQQFCSWEVTPWPCPCHGLCKSSVRPSVSLRLCTLCPPLPRFLFSWDEPTLHWAESVTISQYSCTARQGFLLITAKYHGRQPINIDLLSTPIMNTVTLKKSQYQYNSLLEYFNSAQSAVLLIQEFMIQIIIDCVFASECEIMDNLKAVYEYCIPNWPAEYCQYEYLDVASLF